MRYIKKTVDLDEMGGVDPLPGALFEGENDAHTFQIDAKRGGEAEQLSGEVSAVFDNETRGVSIPIIGRIVDGDAEVTLSPGCYQRGRFTLTVYLSASGQQTALYQATGVIRRAGDGDPYDPDSMIPHMAEFISDYRHMKDATQAAQAAASMAVRYDASQALTSAQQAQARGNIGAASQEAQEAAQSALQAISLASTDAADRISVLESIFAADCTPAQLQAIAASGQTEKYFAPGDIITIPWTDGGGVTPVEYQYPFAVVHIGDVWDENGEKHEHALWLQALHATPVSMAFDYPDRNPVNLEQEPNALEGWYYVGYQSSTGNFTNLGLNPGDHIPTNYSCVYKSALAVTVAVNGHNSWRESAARQWLNSAAAGNEGWWSAQHTGDGTPPAALNQRPGWLNGFPAEWREIFKPVRVDTKNWQGTVITTYDTFFLPTLGQMNASQTAASDAWEYWKSVSENAGATTGADAGRSITPINDPAGSAVRMWTRTAKADTMHRIYQINPNGSAEYQMARLENMLLPCCVIY